MTTISPVAPPLSRPAIMKQDWCDLTFLHWAVEPERVAPLLPPGVRPDVLDGVTYVGLIPFAMRDAGFGRGPAVPWLGSFTETNVRLYSVDDQGRHGVVFRSLESDRLVVSLGARLVFNTPYTWARMSLRTHEEPGAPDGTTVLDYRTSRRWPTPHGAGGRIVVRRDPAPFEPGTLEHFVSARFGLHTQHLGRTWWVPNTHEPWTLHRGELLHLDDTLVAAAGLPGVVDRAPDSVLVADPVHTWFGLPRLLRRRPWPQVSRPASG